MTGYTEETTPPAGPVEIETIYVDRDDRFVVALVVGYKTELMFPPVKGRPIREQALQAAASALALTTDDSADGTHWSVYDRKTKRLFAFEQSEFADREVR